MTVSSDSPDSRRLDRERAILLRLAIATVGGGGPSLRRCREPPHLRHLARTLDRRVRCLLRNGSLSSWHRGMLVHRTGKLPLFAAFAVAAMLLGVVRSATAQVVATGLALDRFDPAERGSEWFVLDTLDLRGRVRPAIGADFDWGHKPLLLYDTNGNQVASVVRDQLFVHLGASLVLWDRIRFGFNLPVAVVQTGDGATLAGATYPAPTSPAVGDLRVGADVRLVGQYRSPFTLAAGARLYV